MVSSMYCDGSFQKSRGPKCAPQIVGLLLSFKVDPMVP